MHTLENEELSVSILDPLADHERFGTRYCTGGYIFQVKNSRLGNLLSGPTYPDDFNVFDGQGIPDSFSHNPLKQQASDREGLVIGIGRCDLEANTVTEFCHWDLTRTDTSITLRTEQQLGDFALRLERHLTLIGRTVRSEITLDNTGNRPIPISWYPHPFFPQLDNTDELCRFNIPVDLSENDGYTLGENGFITRKAWPGWDQAGHFLALDHQATTPLIVLQKHPLVGLVAASCSYIPGFFPIWGNRNTFSWEPYLERTVFKNQTLSWSISYDF